MALRSRLFATLAALAVSAVGSGASAQDSTTVVAVPYFATPAKAETAAGETGLVAARVAEVIASDLRSSGDIVAVGPDNLRTYSYPEATAPSFRDWRSKTAAKALVTGFVQARQGDGDRLTVGCYLHDIAGGRELARQGFSVAAAEWRRAAHRCSDMVYAKLTGRPGWFDSRIAYVAESGAGASRVKRVAIMDSDGSSHRYLTAGESLVLTPRVAPGGTSIAYVSFTGGTPHIRIADLVREGDRALVPPGDMSFAPRFSPDGRRLLFSRASGGNTDIWVASADGGGARRLTFGPGIDTSASFSPDGSKIVFESDRSGTPQIYVMNADGTDPRRISFGGGRYASPVWSPDGESIAFTRIGGDGLRIGVMTPTGGGEKLVSDGPNDEGPSWGANGRNILFQRGDGRSALHIVGIDGGAPRPVTTPQGAVDPDWGSGEKR